MSTAPSGPQIHAVSQDGLWGVIEAKDYPPGIGRSRTRDTPGDALKAPWEGALVTPVGPGSRNKFVLVRMMDLPGQGKLPVKPGSYIPGSVGGKKVIPDYPHRCHVCGGRMLILFSSVEHEGGECPGKPKTIKTRWS